MATDLRVQEEAFCFRTWPHSRSESGGWLAPSHTCRPYHNREINSINKRSPCMGSPLIGAPGVGASFAWLASVRGSVVEFVVWKWEWAESQNGFILRLSRLSGSSCLKLRWVRGRPRGSSIAQSMGLSFPCNSAPAGSGFQNGSWERERWQVPCLHGWVTRVKGGDWQICLCQQRTSGHTIRGKAKQRWLSGFKLCYSFTKGRPPFKQKVSRVDVAMRQKKDYVTKK